MAKLYPPHINGTIPAFYASIEGTTTLVVPFSMNRAVSFAEIKGFMLQIKTLNGSLIGTVPQTAFNEEDLTVSFNVRQFASNFTIGSYYKVQLAYIEANTEEIGYYSTVGITKYTVYPTVIIDKLSTSKTNVHQYDYIGVYSQKNGDATEKLYSSKFIIYDNNDIFYESEEKLHNNTNDTERYMSIESFKFLKSLVENKVYQVQFIATTVNGLVVKSPRYRIVQRKSVDPSIHTELKATLNFNNGYVLLTFDNCQESIISGSYLISRCSNLNNYIWEPVREFSLSSVRADRWSYKDCTIEQGVLYKYSIQQFNKNQVYSSRIESNIIEVDFEDAFLFDGERQLRIRFNPKISSFKTDLQEQKTDTIGHQYPYFTRNSHIYYKEFPISGLISYLSDENELFIKKSELKINYNKWDSADDRQNWDDVGKKRFDNFYEITTQLTANNFISERTFKLTVLEWLNNGKPKLFRSPGEGNYLVRLMNASLSPTDSLSRMLHTFTCTAYEINNSELTTLAEYQIYDRSLTNETQRHWTSINIADYLDDFYQQLAYTNNHLYTKSYWRELKETPQEYYNIVNNVKDNYIKENGKFIPILKNQKLTEIFVVDFMPGSEIKINDEVIVIGTTGSYRVVNELDPFTSFSIDLNSVNSGIITYAYDEMTSDVFGTMEQVVVQDIPCFQTIGTNTYKEVPIYNEDGQVEYFENTYDLLKVLQDNKKSILDIVQLKAIKRPIIDVILNEVDGQNDYRTIISKIINGNYRDLSFNYLGRTFNIQNNTITPSEGELNPLFLYQLRVPNSNKNVTLKYFLPDEELDPRGKEITYIYADHQPYTFEQYYIDKQNKQENDPIFNPYTGYFYDFYNKKIVKATNDLFTFLINDEVIDVSDIESWQVRDLNTKDIEQIIPKDGVILELSYSQQNTIYQFDSLYSSNSDENVTKYRLSYEQTFAFYLIYRNQGYDDDTLNVIKDYCPSVYNTLVENGELRYSFGPLTINNNNNNIILQLPETSNFKVYEPNRQTYIETINLLEKELKNIYKQYISVLDYAIEQYRKDSGVS